jgi:hypothetical protein
MYDIYPIICTREVNYKDITTHLSLYLKEAIDEYPTFVFGASSIFKGYEEGLLKINPRSQDIIILCHDDIKILTDPRIFKDYLKILSKKDTGFIGVAGTSYFNDPCVWWQSPRDTLKGIVWHGDDHVKAPATYFGPYGEAVVMDGVFLACRAELLHKIGMSQPDYLPGSWDFYDILMTLKANLMGYHNYVVPINIMHNSPGLGILQDSWKKNREAMVNKFKKHFPRKV